MTGLSKQRKIIWNKHETMNSGMKRSFVFVIVIALVVQITACTKFQEDIENLDNRTLGRLEAVKTEAVNNTFDKDLLIKAINLNCKYVLQDWWEGTRENSYQSSYLPDAKPLTTEQKAAIEESKESFVNWAEEKYLQIPNWQKNNFSENAILPHCYASRILSTAIHYDIYDASITGISENEAIKKTVLLITSLIKYHCSNSENGWGNCWQGALWAEMVGMSAFLMKDYLSDENWIMLYNMIQSESNYVIHEAGVKVYKDRGGNIREGREGDSQSETDAWNATILALALVAFPDNENQKIWREKFIELNVEAMTCPSDVYSDRVIDGYSFINSYGSNINEDGTVTNHNKIHIDYMASPIESLAESSIALSFAEECGTFNCLKFNVDKVYNALVELDLGEFESSKAGHHFYERTANGRASSDTNMPEENEWGNNRQANYLLVDTYVSLIGADSSLDDNLKADKWARCRIEKIIEMMGRDESGRIYQYGEENFASGQLYAMACLGQVYSLISGNMIGASKIATKIQASKEESNIINAITGKIKRHMYEITDSFPDYTSEQNLNYELRGNRSWTSGFYPGEVYLAYEATLDENFLTNRKTFLDSFEHRLVERINLDHDIGFLYTLSCVNLYNATGDERARELAIQAADILKGRFITRGGYIQAWDTVNDNRPYRYMIIDTMMNLPLLYWASEITGDNSYAEIANAHADTTIKTLIRNDHSIIPRCLISSETGEVYKWENGVAVSLDTTWARGQAWAVYGYALAYQYTGNDIYLQTAQALADFFISNLPVDSVPYYDLSFTDDNPDLKDTSAASIFACGLIELGKVKGDTDDSYINKAKDIIDRLCQEYFIEDEDVIWLLRGSTYTKDEGNGCTIWGDYFFFEGLLKLNGFDISAEI